MKGKTLFNFLIGMAVITMVGTAVVTSAILTDTEQSTDNALRCWISSLWVQTSQADFEAGVLNGVDISSSPGDVKLASSGSSNWYNSSWQYRRQITIDHTKVDDVADPSTAYAGFPVLVYATGLSNVKAGGADIRFTSSDGTTELPREIESYSAGTLYSWVKVTLTKDSSNSTDDIIYMYYGNALATEPAPDSTYGSQNVWTNGYEAVYHLHDNFNDATGNYNAINNGSVDTSGKVADGQDFTPISEIQPGNWSVGVSAITIQAWANFDNFTIDDPRIFSKANGTAEQSHVYMLSLSGTGERYLRARIKTGTNDAAGTTTLIASLNPLTAGTWDHVALTYNGSNMTLYRNGVNSGSTAKTGDLRQNTWDMKIGNNPGSSVSMGCMDGKLDEVRISSVARSANWLTTEHSNQNNPLTFCGIGTEENNISYYSSSGTIASQVLDTGIAGATWDELSWQEIVGSTAMNWYNSSWQYRRAISLSPATSVADYQVLVTLDTATMGSPYSNVNADGSDIRFTAADGTTLQDYWIETWDNTGTSNIWVEVSTSGTSTIYMYYGNATASSASDGTATFVFFDDFNRPDSATVGNGWMEAETASTAEIASNSLQFTPADDVKRPIVYKTFTALNGGFVWQTNFNWTRTGAESWYWVYMQLGDSVVLDNTQPAENLELIHPQLTRGTGVDLVWWGGASATHQVLSYYDNSAIQPDVATISGNHIIEVIGDTSAGTFDINIDGGAVEKTGASMNVTTTLNEMRFLAHGLNNNNFSPRQFGYTFIRKYVSPEPVASVEAEEIEYSVDIIFEVRASDTQFLKGDATPSWTAAGGTSPVTSGLPLGRYMQWRTTLTTSEPSKTPTLHEVTITYY